MTFKTPKPRIKTLEQIDREYIDLRSSVLTLSAPRKVKNQPNRKPIPAEVIEPAADMFKTKRSRVRSCVSGALFYTVLAALVLCVYLFAGTSTGPPRSLLGFSAMTVLSSSMHSEIPKGSLIITRHTESGDIKVGDDITFLREDNTTVTHRVIGIYENYKNTHQIGFETKGVDNLRADSDIIIGSNVIGKVVFTSMFLGKMLKFIRDNAVIIVILTALVIGLFVALRIFFKSGRKSVHTAYSEEARKRKIPKRRFRLYSIPPSV